MLNLQDFMKRLDESTSTGVQYDHPVLTNGDGYVDNNIPSPSVQQPTGTSYSVSSTDEYKGDPDLMRLLYTVDEEGYAYSIPGLSKDNPNYVKEYVAFMRLRENDPEAFKRVLNWE